MHDEVARALACPIDIDIDTEREASSKNPRRKTIFEELRDSNLPPDQKAVDRLKEEGFILVLAGGDTSAKVLTTLTYHLLSNPNILRRLKAELVKAMPDPNASLPAIKLEQLPYLVNANFLAKPIQKNTPDTITNARYRKQ